MSLGDKHLWRQLSFVGSFRAQAASNSNLTYGTSRWILCLSSRDPDKWFWIVWCCSASRPKEVVWSCLRLLTDFQKTKTVSRYSASQAIAPLALVQISCLFRADPRLQLSLNSIPTAWQLFHRKQISSYRLKSLLNGKPAFNWAIISAKIPSALCLAVLCSWMPQLSWDICPVCFCRRWRANTPSRLGRRKNDGIPAMNLLA